MTENINDTRIGNWIQTFTNKRFYPLDPREDEIDIVDIAHALSMKCRFTGHTNRFYSVAEHSVHVSYNCFLKNALWGLLHDAAEAYLADVAKPIKVLPEFSKFVEVENKLQAAICAKFGLPIEQPEDVHSADRILLLTEKRDLMKPMNWPQNQFYYKESPLERKIEALSPMEAELLFLRRFIELTSPNRMDSK